VGSPIHQKVRHKPDDSLDSTFPRTSRFLLTGGGCRTALTRHHTQAATRRSPASWPAASARPSSCGAGRSRRTTATRPTARRPRPLR
jgi:hypothetical protein